MNQGKRYEYYLDNVVMDEIDARMNDIAHDVAGISTHLFLTAVKGSSVEVPAEKSGKILKEYFDMQYAEELLGVSKDIRSKLRNSAVSFLLTVTPAVWIFPPKYGLMIAASAYIGLRTHTRELPNQLSSFMYTRNKEEYTETEYAESLNRLRPDVNSALQEYETPETLLGLPKFNLLDKMGNNVFDNLNAMVQAWEQNNANPNALKFLNYFHNYASTGIITDSSFAEMIVREIDGVGGQENIIFGKKYYEFVLPIIKNDIKRIIMPYSESG